MLPLDFPDYRLVHYYFRKWSRDGTIEEIHEVLRTKLRLKRGRNISSSVGMIDSQSVKTTRVGGKRLKGRKRHIITDTQGFLLAVKIHSANTHDSQEGIDVIRTMRGQYERMQKIYADGGYRGELAENMKNKFGWDMEITLKSDKTTDFKPLPKR